MGKKNSATMSKRIKTRHKKTGKIRKPITQNIQPVIRDINKVISQKIAKHEQTKTQKQQQHPQNQQPVQIQIQTVNIDTLRKLTGGQKKQKLGKFSIDDGLYLEKLLKRWGTNYARMAQDIKLNRLQWTAQQIQKKHQIYKKMFPQENVNN